MQSWRFLRVLLIGSILPCGVLRPEVPPDTSEFAKLVTEAQKADLRDRPHLYARLVEDSVDLANRAVADGDAAAAAAALHEVSSYAAEIEATLGAHSKKLQDAEILLRKSAFRLHSSMLGASYDYRAEMAAALKDVNAAENQVMAAVFAH